MKHPKSLFFVPALTLLACSGANAASVLAFNGTPATGSGQSARGDGPYTIGASFTVTTSGLSITQLGVQDTLDSTDTISTNGFATSPITVGLWSWDGVNANTASLLTPGVTVASTDPQDAGGYRYVTLGTAVPLTNGGKYLIGAFVGSGHEFFLDYNDGSSAYSDSEGTTDGITFNGSSFAGGDAAPTNVQTGSFIARWGAANATVIPEPASALLGSLGLLALLRRRR